jgi:lipopolysaccharide/colanic/teichoic acid biosynthesis glycosyltransferase
LGKRIFDLVLAGLGLLLLSPLLAALALWIKLDSPGPVLYRQQRVGRYGVLFSIHKFRTMRHATQPLGPEITVGADPRLTQAGAWLRKHKLDELPQLIDVLQGTMSLVGPRPEVPRYVALYPSDLREQVLAARPGITDPASLAFSDEAALLAQTDDPEREYVEVVMPAKLRHAVAYQQQATLWTDIQLLTLTLKRLWAGKGQGYNGRP